MSATSGTNRSAEASDSGSLTVSNGMLLDTLWASMVSLYADLTTATASHGLTYSQAKALNVLRQGPAPMRALAGTLRCDASNMTGIVDRLEARGLVYREPAARRPAGQERRPLGGRGGRRVEHPRRHARHPPGPRLPQRRRAVHPRRPALAPVRRRGRPGFLTRNARR